MNVCTKFAWVIGTVAGIAGTALAVPPSVLTQDYDMTRSGANLAETVLTPANVSASTFGKLFEFPADEEVWAQPLYLPGLAIAGGTHNVVFVATQGNSVFAFDADNPATASTPLWSVNLGAPVPASKFNFTSTGVSHAGIYSTPVIDTNLGALYVVTEVWNSGTQTVSMLLHALSITTGQELFGGPVNVTAPGFDPGVNEQLGGLLLLNGIVYLPIASHGDVQTNMANLQTEPYFGYVLAYNASSLAEVGAFNVEPGGAGGGIWQGGRGLASDGMNGLANRSLNQLRRLDCADVHLNASWMFFLEIGSVNGAAQRRAQVSVLDVADNSHDGDVVFDVIASALRDGAAQRILRRAVEALCKSQVDDRPWADPLRQTQ